MINLLDFLFHREAHSMGNKKSEPDKVKDIKICELCGKPIKDGELYVTRGPVYTHEICNTNILKYGKVTGK
jgi:hypothetical protein